MSKEGTTGGCAGCPTETAPQLPVSGNAIMSLEPSLKSTVSSDTPATIHDPKDRTYRLNYAIREVTTEALF